MNKHQEPTTENPYQVTGNSLPASSGQHRFSLAKFLLGGLAWTMLWYAGAGFLISNMNTSDTFIHDTYIGGGVDGDDGPTAIFVSSPFPLWAAVSLLSVLLIGWLLILFQSARAATMDFLPTGESETNRVSYSRDR